MPKLQRLFALALLGASGSAVSGAMPLNTGYDHAPNVNALYPIGAADNYWIKIGSYEPPAPGVAVAPGRVVNLSTPFGTIAGARWIAPRLSPASTSGTNLGRPAYSLYRKCFCLLDGYANPTLSVAVRADDYVQVWLNSVTNTIVGPTFGNFFTSQGGPLQGFARPDHFRVGRNCLYVLVEDVGGVGAFTLAGSVNAAGLMPVPAIGNNGNFGPCGCPSEPNSAEGGHGAPTASNDVGAALGIVRSAEERQPKALARVSQGPGAEGPGLGH